MHASKPVIGLICLSFLLLASTAGLLFAAQLNYQPELRLSEIRRSPQTEYRFADYSQKLQQERNIFATDGEHWAEPVTETAEVKPASTQQQQTLDKNKIDGIIVFGSFNRLITDTQRYKNGDQINGLTLNTIQQDNIRLTDKNNQNVTIKLKTDEDQRQRQQRLEQYGFRLTEDTP